jgi:hypothetical protein
MFQELNCCTTWSKDPGWSLATLYSYFISVGQIVPEYKVMLTGVQAFLPLFLQETFSIAFWPTRSAC